jgi:hypothetical protein
MITRLVPVLARLVLLIVLVGSALYVAVSMYRWEWQRATFAAIVCLGTLMIVLVLVLLRRLDRLEQRVEQTAGAAEAGAGGPATVPTRPGKDFTWLAPVDSTFVFVPLLLGFGVVVSLAAVALERMVGFLVGAAARTTPNSPRSRPARGRTALLAAGGFVVTLVLAGLLAPTVADLVYDPEPPQAGYRTIDVDVRGRRVLIDPETATASLAVYCRVQTSAPIEIIDVSKTRLPNRVRITVQPRLDSEAQQRYEGCLGDLLMDRHLTRVVAVQDVDAVPSEETANLLSASDR